MDKKIFWVLDTEIKDGKTDEVKSLMNEMIDFTQKNEPGAVHYEWFISSDSKNVHCSSITQTQMQRWFI
ncbi:MAG: hypothetical protein IPP52_16480 [Ignavibacteria bacterium]|nr:hypothetical protein [Ignavibacteria bacterium]